MPVAAPHSGERAPALDGRKDSRDVPSVPMAMAAGSATGMPAHTKQADVNPGQWSEANNPKAPKNPGTAPVKRVHFADDISTDIRNANSDDVAVAFVAHATSVIVPGDKTSLRLLTARFSMTPAQQRELLRPKGRAPDDDGEEMSKWQTLTNSNEHDC